MSSPARSLGLRGFADTMHRESDRACAVLAAAYLDVTLEDFLRSHLVADAPETLFEALGPLASFAAKIDLAYAVGWISGAEHADLHTVRRINLAFLAATEREPTFSNPVICDECERFVHTNAFLAEVAEGHFTPQAFDHIRRNPRARFETAIGFVRQALVYRMSIADHAGSPASLGAEDDAAVG